MNEDYYVYIHRRADNGQVFYIGKGRLRRANNKSLRSVFWKRLVSKYGYWVEKTQENMSEKDALLLEMWLIAKYMHLGYRLCNRTLGGDGCLGMSMSDESKRKCGIKNIGRKLSKEHIEKLREINRNRVLTKEQRDNLSIKAKLRGFPSRKISDKEVTSSEGITYKSLMDARRDMEERLGFSSKSANIGLCCSGDRGNAFGLNWSYGREIPNPPYGTIGRPIIETNTGKVYKSASQFSDIIRDTQGFKVDGRTVLRCIKEKRQYKGFNWRFLDEN